MATHPILRLTASRLLTSLIAIFGASIVAFALLRVVPGDPARLVLGSFASEDAVDALSDEMGLHDSILTQYIVYMRDFFSGDWGISYATGEAVTTQMENHLPATVELGLFAFLFAVAGAFALAVTAAYRRRRTVDAAAGGISYLGLGIPPFWLALILLILFFDNLGWFPGPEGRLSTGTSPPPSVTGLYTFDALIAGEWAVLADALWHLALPAIALGLFPMAFLMRLLRASLQDVSGEPFLLVARSKGLGRLETFVRHALPNALLPTLTAGGILFGQLLGGSVLVERVFNWPGVGALVTEGILRQDFAVVQVFILLSVVIYVVINLVVDILYGVIDPRAREVGAAA